MSVKNLFMAAGVALSVACALADVSTMQPGVGSSQRYATDAYPGFDNDDSIVSPEKKEPKWFAFINGPNRDNAKDQMSYCADLILAGDHKKAAKQLDALVREWPSSPEAPKAQRMLADIYTSPLAEYEDAFAEYRYLLDFYSMSCDYDEIADKLYQLANLMRQEGKTIVFFHFRNTVDVRRAFEACVLHAPGAKWAPTAMLTIGDLREEEEQFDEAVKVYENLRNIHGDCPEAKTAVLREAMARIALLRKHIYNRDRCLDTINFFKRALTTCRLEDVDAIKDYLAEAKGLVEEEAYQAAKFYDSRVRTERSAINAYRRFLDEYPESAHAGEIQTRLETLEAKAAKAEMEKDAKRK